MKKTLVLSVLLGLGFISCAKGKEVKTEEIVVNDSIKTDSAEITPRQPEEELTFEETFKRAHVGEGLLVDEDWEITKVSNTEYKMGLSKEKIKQMEINNPKNVNEQKLPRVPANVRNVKTLKGKGYRFSSPVEGDIYYIRFVVTDATFRLSDNQIMSLSLKSKLNWEYEYGFDYFELTRNDGGIFYEVVKTSGLGKEIMIPCYIGGRTKKALMPITN